MNNSSIPVWSMGKTNIMLKNWQHNVLLVRGISCYSTVCGFRFPDQSGESSCPWCNLRYVICYTRPFLRSSSSCEQLLYSRLVEHFSLRLPGHLPADCLGIRLFVFNLLLLSVWRFFIPTFPEEISVLNVFWNKIVTFGHLSQTVVYRSLSYFSLQQTSAKPCGALGYVNCMKCLAVKILLF